VGLFTVSLFAMLAAVYLTLEPTEDEQLRDDFRARALVSALLSAVLAAVTSLQRFDERALAFSVPIGSALLIALLIRRYGLARSCAIALVTLVIAAWGLTQRKLLANPAPEATLRLLVPTLGLGALVLFPSLYWLMRVFKSR
jgi:cytochrome d ubiquinol oxidase subunit II